ncbi:MAG: ABC transporter substrate-binding protein [Proteobacteria bacterium]|nr:ABC transporter substrate-binding protein [Pseudomonadota bacterium]MBI3497055.1 ABC transporter substrate-binding protein [Pseudomonadota bacterium]
MHSLIVLAALAIAWGPSPALAEKASVAALRLSSSGPLFLAADKGFFKDEGLEVEFKFFTAAQPVAVAVVAGDADLGVTGLTAGFYNLAGKGALKIIAGQSREEPGYRLSAYMASNQAWEKGLRQPKDLAGRSVAMTQVGSTFHYMIGLLAEKHRFPLSGMRLVALQSIPNMVSALQGGQVEAAVMPSTVALPMAARGEAKIIGWAGDETPWQLGALFTRPFLIERKRPLAERFVRAFQRGAAAYDAAFQHKTADGKPADADAFATALAIIAKYTEQPRDSLQLGLPYVDPEARFSARDIAHQVKWWQGEGLVDAGADAAAIIEAGFVPPLPD